MLDLDTQAVTGWLQAIQPARTDHDWPPPIRAIERAEGAQELFDELSQALGRHQAGDGRRLADALAELGTVELLRSVLAQLGAARMLRIVSALSDLLPDGKTTAGLHRQLRNRDTPDGRALAAALDATARTTLRGRLTAQDRLEALRRALEQAQEQTP